VAQAKLLIIHTIALLITITTSLAFAGEPTIIPKIQDRQGFYGLLSAKGVKLLIFDKYKNPLFALNGTAVKTGVEGSCQFAIISAP
jgi:hypothetical protein